MEEVKGRGELERTVLAILSERGWTVTGAERRGVDLDLHVELDGTAGVIQFRNPFQVAGPDGRTAESAPNFIRIDLGRPTGEPTRWSVWDRYRFPGSKYSPSYHATVLHEAIGDGWASLAGCSLAPGRSWYAEQDVIKLLLSRAEVLAPGQPEVSRREQIFYKQRCNYGAQSPRAQDIASVVMLLLVGGLLPLFPLFAWPPADAENRSLTIIVLLLMGGLPPSIMLPVGLVKLVRLFSAGLPPLEGMAAIVEALRGSGAFTELSPTARKDRDGLPVVVRDQDVVDEGAVSLSVSRLTARSTSHGLTLDADLCQLTWSDGALPETRFVPERWLTVEMSGSEAELDRLPSGPREERHDGVLRWTFTGAELDAGDAQEHFRQIAARSATAGPYR